MKYGCLLMLSICLLTVFGCNPETGKQVAVKGKIEIKGSDTEVNLVQRLAESYMKTNPAVSISVTGGGSGTGIAAIINGKTDIANSSRPMTEKELKQAQDKGVTAIAVVFAVDGLAIIVHDSIPVAELTIPQLGEIFKGTIANWKELGGPDLAISLYGRQSNSGTYIYFRDTVVKGDYSAHMRNMNGTAQIVEAIKSDKAGIGYVGIGYVVNEQGKVTPGLKVLKLAKNKADTFVSPTEAINVKSGTYPLSRPLYQYLKGVPTGDLLAFVQFELSETGQKIIEQEGFYAISESHLALARTLGIVK